MPRPVSAEFKRECVEFVLVHGYKHKDAAKAMGFGLSSIQRWVERAIRTNA
ncbi:MAG: hypothetical protein CENE_01495 [Candidatus Celerinatantimonas neptuna]|nr:MAG: hypothetical protein CENE_01495 [Candidatus Celerinatantimonas neptuna]